MANLNKVMLIGNITRDPELKYLPNQMAVCDFGLAINRTWTGQDGVKKEETTFVDCTCFGKTAEVFAKYSKKGDPRFVEGRLKLDQWQAQDGSNRSKLKVTVENFQFLNRGQPGGYGAPAADAEYAGEPAQGGGGYAPRQQPGNFTPRPAGRPVAAAQQTAPPQPAAQAAPDYDAGDAIPEDAAPQIKDEDIPF